MKNKFPALKKKELPIPPHWTKALGVGIVVAGLAMGTGELILWPHLVTSYGFKIFWLALLGISFEFFLNQEIARHSLATGEGFFTTSARIVGWSAPMWFLFAILLYVWPGWASAIGTILAELAGFGSHYIWSLVALALVLVFTFSGKRAYATLENTLKIIVPTFFVLLVVISFFNLTFADLKEAIIGTLSFGYIPEGIDINKLFGAVVFTGAGGMLNLCISLWYRDKQLGMSKYVGQIKNPITGKKVAVATTGYTFDANNKTMQKRWKDWMRYVRADQGLIFLIPGFIAMFLLSLNAYAVLSPKGIVPDGTDVAIMQANIFGEQWGAFGFNLFLIMAFLMLFAVMWAVLDGLTRMLSDIIYTNSHVGPLQKLFGWSKNISLGELYYGIIAIIVVVGAFLIPLHQPLTLLVISGVLSGLSMAIYAPMLIYMNNVHLPKPLRPHWITNIIMVGISGFFIFFAIQVIISYFS
jgi:Mn2+/Fe2+ NRAMP family transporter